MTADPEVSRLQQVISMDARLADRRSLLRLPDWHSQFS